MSSRRLEVASDGDEIKIAFPYDPRLLPVVREIPGRRFDRGEKAWYCPADEVVEAVKALLPHRFSIAAEVRELYREAGGEDLDEPGDEARSAGGSLTVSELNARVRAALLKAFPESLWLVGEITGFERNRHRRHAYFEIAEKDEEGEDSTVRATVAAVMFERERREIEHRLAEADPPFELRDGIEVRVRVGIELYEARGSYQVVVEDVDPVHTLGKLAQNRARILAELDQSGLREKNLSLQWPELPLRIGLITSLGSDAYNDFVAEILRSGYSFEVTAVNARMQGQGLERDVVAALRTLKLRQQELDVVAIVRGGGARTDLMWFDSREVAFEVARFPVKIVTGIGHERDVSVLDMITHREKTPTAAAAVVVQQIRALEERMHAARRRLPDLVESALAARRSHLRDCGRGLARATAAVRRWSWAQLRSFAERMPRSVRTRLLAQRRSLRRVPLRLASLARAPAKVRARELELLTRRLSTESFSRLFARHHTRLEHLAQHAEDLHPRRVMARGYAVVTDASGKLVRDATRLRPGAEIRASLARGSLRAEVTVVEDDEPIAEES